MRKSILISAIVTACLGFYAAGSPKEKCRVRMIVHYYQKKTDTTEYSYNAEGHIVSLGSPRGRYVTYRYIQGRILRKYQDPIGTRFYVDTLKLNRQGLVEEITSDNKNFFSRLFEYDTDKHLMKSFEKGWSDVTAYNYVNGNEVSSIQSDKSGNITYQAGFQYDLKHISTIGNENLGADFNGADSKNPVTYCSYPRNVNQRINYSFDEKGRILTKASYDLNTGKIQDSTSYIYYSGARLVIDR